MYRAGPRQPGLGPSSQIRPSLLPPSGRDTQLISHRRACAFLGGTWSTNPGCQTGFYAARAPSGPTLPRRASASGAIARVPSGRDRICRLKSVSASATRQGSLLASKAVVRRERTSDRSWRYHDLQHGPPRCLLPGGGKACLYGRHQAQSGHSRERPSSCRSASIIRAARRALDLLAPTYRWFTEGFENPDLQEAKLFLDQP